MNLVLMTKKDAKKLERDSTPLTNLIDESIYDQVRDNWFGKQSIFQWNTTKGIDSTDHESSIATLSEIFGHGPLYERDYHGHTAVWGFQWTYFNFILMQSKEGMIIQAPTNIDINKIPLFLKELKGFLYGEL